jgi:hypothetical protein
MQSFHLNADKYRMIKKPFLLAGLALAVLTLPATARAAEVFHFRDLAARAEFFTTDQSGTSTDVFVQAFKERFQHPPGPPEPTGPFLVISIAKFNFSQQDSQQCFSVLMSAFAFVPITEQNFQIDRKLGSASLTASGIELFDIVSQTSFSVDIDLNWTANGDAAQVTDNFHLRVPGFSIGDHFKGTFRPAAVSGSISDGTTNFASLPLFFADMFATKDGQAVITH